MRERDDDVIIMMIIWVMNEILCKYFFLIHHTISYHIMLYNKMSYHDMIFYLLCSYIIS